MKKITLLAISFICFSSVFSQSKLISLHPIVGDTVVYYEKAAYLLFPEIPDSGFVYAFVQENEQGYSLHTLQDNKNKVRPIDSAEIYTYYQNIEKLFAYYMGEDQEADASPIVSTNDLPTTLTTNYLSPAMRKQIRKDAMRYQSLTDDAEDLGLSGIDKQRYIQTGGYTEITIGKKK